MLSSKVETVGSFTLIQNFGNTVKPEVIQGKITQSVLGFSFYEKGKARIISSTDREVGTKTSMNWSVFFASAEVGSIYRELPKGIELSQLTVLVPIGYLQQKLTDSSLENSLLRRFVYPDNIYVNQQQSPVTQELLSPIMKILECKLAGEFRTMYLEAQCLEILSILCFHQLQLTTSAALDKATIDKLYLARDILTKNFNAPPTIEQLSKQIGLNTFALKQGFKQLFSQPPHTWITVFRMNYAQTKLVSKNYSVTEVAELLGYSNPNSFNAAYTKHFGHTPGKASKLLKS
ncbi:helix-turn-helix domain-containing protein [Tunicatimonas pelagia]|uniref:helix-turn-helix domain-containing protein n=1 Tax=Tunicatimonas pelagia TaxID=931531 RepID=UPI0026671391|nr:AraC family transcriptional regulator [Tunicatimonas pelagia]WKN43475.1 AraC family transcriptional regulator [Tunicatimonas pelagia]